MNRKTELTNELAFMTSELDALQQEIENFKLNAVKELYGMEVGAVGVSGSVERKITRIHPIRDSLNRPCVQAMIRNKDQSWRKAANYCYGWQPLPVPPEVTT